MFSPPSRLIFEPIHVAKPLCSAPAASAKPPPNRSTRSQGSFFAVPHVMMNSTCNQGNGETFVFGLDLLAADGFEGGNEEHEEGDRHAHGAIGDPRGGREEPAPSYIGNRGNREPGMEKLSPKLRSTRKSQRSESSTNPSATTYSSYFIFPSFLYMLNIFLQLK